MLIKNYAGYPAGSVLTIEEGVSDVVVYLGTYSLSSNGPRFVGDKMPTTWVEPIMTSVETLPQDDVTMPALANQKRFIDYTSKEGVRCRMSVYAFAYVCNDDGKTVEKVIVE